MPNRRDGVVFEKNNYTADKTFHGKGLYNYKLPESNSTLRKKLSSYEGGKYFELIVTLIVSTRLAHCNLVLSWVCLFIVAYI